MATDSYYVLKLYSNQNNNGILNARLPSYQQAIVQLERIRGHLDPHRVGVIFMAYDSPSPVDLGGLGRLLAEIHNFAGFNEMQKTMYNKHDICVAISVIPQGVVFPIEDVTRPILHPTQAAQEALRPVEIVVFSAQGFRDSCQDADAAKRKTSFNDDDFSEDIDFLSAAIDFPGNGNIGSMGNGSMDVVGMGNGGMGSMGYGSMDIVGMGNGGIGNGGMGNGSRQLQHGHHGQWQQATAAGT